MSEETSCKSCCAPLEKDVHCHECFEDAIRVGFEYALQQYGIYKDGIQVIGCMETDIKTVMKRFIEEKTVKFLVNQIMKD